MSGCVSAFGKSSTLLLDFHQMGSAQKIRPEFDVFALKHYAAWRVPRSP
jgi:hypothetical protein